MTESDFKVGKSQTHSRTSKNNKSRKKKAGESRKPNKSRESDTTAAGTGFTVKLQ